MASEAVGDDFRIFVHLPPGYDGSSERYPVVYQLDGSTQSEPVAAMAEELGISVIVVGVGYADGFSPPQRIRDYLPTPDERISDDSGRSDRFFAFLETELVPRIDDDYRVADGRRTLMGHSAGGAAAFFALLSQDASAPVFDCFAVISPNFAWDSGSMLDVEEDRARGTRDLPGKLFIAYGEVEYTQIVTYTRAMVDRLEERDYPGLDLEVREIEDASHNQTWPEAYPTALERFHGE